MNETLPMVAPEFLSRQDLRPITIRCVNPQPPNIVVPGLQLTRTLLADRRAEATFTELPGGSSPRRTWPSFSKCIRPEKLKYGCAGFRTMPTQTRY